MLLLRVMMMMVENMGVLSHLVNNLLHSARLVQGLRRNGALFQVGREEQVGGNGRLSQLLLFPNKGDNSWNKKTG